MHSNFAPNQRCLDPFQGSSVNLHQCQRLLWDWINRLWHGMHHYHLYPFDYLRIGVRIRFHWHWHCHHHSLIETYLGFEMYFPQLHSVETYSFLLLVSVFSISLSLSISILDRTILSLHKNQRIRQQKWQFRKKYNLIQMWHCIYTCHLLTFFFSFFFLSN